MLMQATPVDDAAQCNGWMEAPSPWRVSRYA
jgi:hypothetical protein